MNYFKANWALIAGPLLSLALAIVLLANDASGSIIWTASITVLVAFWWVTEPIPIPATSLIPLALFPLVGVLTTEEVAQAYGNWLILLMLGGFMLLVATPPMPSCSVHRSFRCEKWPVKA